MRGWAASRRASHARSISGRQARAIQSDELQAESALRELQLRLGESGSGLQLVQIAGGYQLSTRLEHADAIYVFDPAIVTDHGAIILSMGKPERRGEEAAMARCLEALGVPILYTLHGGARAEGGDLLRLDHDTLAVGQGFRTNAEGLQQLREALNEIGVRVLPVELPYYTGPEACLHLLSLISIVDRQVAVVYPPLLAVPFWQELKRRDFKLIEVPDAEFATMGPNVLALAPGRCLMLEGNPITRQRLEEAGCQVMTYRGNEISLKAEGGPTCLTRPVLRGSV